jgi:hypothetical protein
MTFFSQGISAYSMSWQIRAQCSGLNPSWKDVLRKETFYFYTGKYAICFTEFYCVHDYLHQCNSSTLVVCDRLGGFRFYSRNY